MEELAFTIKKRFYQAHMTDGERLLFVVLGPKYHVFCYDNGKNGDIPLPLQGKHGCMFAFSEDETMERNLRGNKACLGDAKKMLSDAIRMFDGIKHSDYASGSKLYSYIDGKGYPIH
jgi:hypothetical protein